MKTQELIAKYNSPANFFNRELSWLEFNRRVLEEALNPDAPLLEKVKFLSIFFSNLDEFYMIRVSGLKEQILEKRQKETIDGMDTMQQIEAIERNLEPMLMQANDLWNNELRHRLAEEGIVIHAFNHELRQHDGFTQEEVEIMNDHFDKYIYPILTPLATDPGRPFPHISNLSLSFAIKIKSPKGEEHFARVKVPAGKGMNRLYRVDEILHKKLESSAARSGPVRFVWLGDLIKCNLHKLFPGMTIEGAYRFRVTRDTDIEILEDEADDLLNLVEKNIKQRKFGQVVRLEVESKIPEDMLDLLIENLEIGRESVHLLPGAMALSDIMSLYDLPFPHLKNKPFFSQKHKHFEDETDIFAVIKKNEVLLHHPYHSFSPVVDFIKQAAADPDVLAIKQTLYRVGSNSPVVRALIEAAEAGKQVAVLVELKARFDEENNIKWARELEQVGAHVVYGLLGLKTHAKMTLVVRREQSGIKRYVHLATGNYNATTSRMYTDMGYFTTDKDICSDVTEVFNFLTGYSKQTQFRKLFVAPFSLRDKLLDLIYTEIEHASKGREARIIFKANALVDPAIICALYEASGAGVKIDLIIRGICCLVPGVPGLSENIRVISVVGRFLEHHRIYYIHNNGDEMIYLSSADLMQRNLDGRVELAFPIEDPSIKKYIKSKVLFVMLNDNMKARVLDSNMNYTRLLPKGDEKPLDSQEWLMNESMRKSAKRKKKK
ncbi:MAG: polyphosphate kinase 1 [Ignavibacteriaceae bacterium]|nr:polyphosphate kinase 1 [Ignavibacteriaceae bacterium]